MEETKPLPGSVARIRIRLGRCYELTAHIMLHEAAAKTWRLVHGRRGVAHAWILSIEDGTIYDPALHKWFDRTEYELRATAERTYTQAEAAAQIVLHKHSGPWHESEVA